jgi:hypothetical protein
MARLRIIILEQSNDDLRCLLWADVPAARQSHYANPNLVSIWLGATAADNDALKSGAVTEKELIQRVPPGVAWPQIQTFLETQWNNFQAQTNNFNPWTHYGSTWNGTTWDVLTNG